MVLEGEQCSIHTSKKRVTDVRKVLENVDDFEAAARKGEALAIDMRHLPDMEAGRVSELRQLLELGYSDTVVLTRIRSPAIYTALRDMGGQNLRDQMGMKDIQYTHHLTTDELEIQKALLFKPS